MLVKDKNTKLFMARLNTIASQLTLDQMMELATMIPNNKGLSNRIGEELTTKEIKALHDKFITLQYSENPVLQGKDIRGVQIYPYKTKDHE